MIHLSLWPAGKVFMSEEACYSVFCECVFMVSSQPASHVRSERFEYN